MQLRLQSKIQQHFLDSTDMAARARGVFWCNSSDLALGLFPDHLIEEWMAADTVLLC